MIEYVNCYELDIVKAHPLEMKRLHNECNQLKTKNKQLIMVLVLTAVALGGYFIYKAMSREEELKEPQRK